MKHSSTRQRRKEILSLRVVQLSPLPLIYHQTHPQVPPNRHPARILLCHSLPPRCPCLAPLNLQVSLHMAKEDFADVIKLRIFRGGDHPGSCRRAQAFTSILIRGRSGHRNRFDDGTKRLTTRRKGSQVTQKAGGLQELQKARKMPWLSRRNQLCQTLWHQPNETDSRHLASKTLRE